MEYFFLSRLSDACFSRISALALDSGVGFDDFDQKEQPLNNRIDDRAKTPNLTRQILLSHCFLVDLTTRADTPAQIGILVMYQEFNSLVNSRRALFFPFPPVNSRAVDRAPCCLLTGCESTSAPPTPGTLIAYGGGGRRHIFLAQWPAICDNGPYQRSTTTVGRRHRIYLHPVGGPTGIPRKKILFFCLTRGAILVTNAEIGTPGALVGYKIKLVKNDFKKYKRRRT